MRFKRGARLNTGQVRDRRGARGGGLGGGMPMAIGGGGSVIGLLVILAIMFLGGGMDQLGGVGGGGADTQVSNSSLEQDCQTGEDANERQDCRIVAVVNSVQEFWDGEFERRSAGYQLATTELFTSATTTACGQASSAVGPFYCPADQTIYIDLSFYEDLRSRFGAQGGPFAEAYVIAHEYGHHVQHLLGLLDEVGGASGPGSNAVRTELQADCFAGTWAHHAASTEVIEQLTQADIAAGLDAAAAIGDDRLQERFEGRVNPESWTHGSAEQRQRWFLVGYETGDMEQCDTFRGDI